jgi:hypothetical protein
LCYLIGQGQRKEAYMGEDLDREAVDDSVRGEDDHDLLTFAESGIRIREEIALVEAALSENPATGQREALQARLRVLTDALTRNTRQAEAYPGEKGFLGYAPPAPAGADAERDQS